jgi:flavin reductase (DIM6/NTAB) family NADH-FMN oxidoreductase RutF
MHYDPLKNDHGLPHRPFNALVVPRPIGWISTIGLDGQVNLAPYSYFNAAANDPPMVMFSSTGKKDSQTNAERTGEFTCSLCTWDLRNEMNITSSPVGPGVSEPALAGLEMAPSRVVKPPRVARAPAALECKYLKTVELKTVAGGAVESQIIFGQVVSIYIDDAIITDGYVDWTKAKPLARLGYMEYTMVETVFEMKMPKGIGPKP